MNVLAQDTSSAARCALVRLRGGHATIETPSCLVYTSRASVPHLVAEHVARLPSFGAVHYSISNTFRRSLLPALTAYGKGIASFANLQVIFSHFHVDH